MHVYPLQIFKQLPFDGTKATSSDFVDDRITSSKMLAVPAPTTATLTSGVPAALRTKPKLGLSFDIIKLSP